MVTRRATGVSDWVLLDGLCLVQGAALLPEGQVDEYAEGRATPRTNIVGVDVTDVPPDQQGKEVSHAMKCSSLSVVVDFGPLDIFCSSLLDLICVISADGDPLPCPSLRFEEPQGKIRMTNESSNVLSPYHCTAVVGTGCGGGLLRYGLVPGDAESSQQQTGEGLPISSSISSSS